LARQSLPSTWCGEPGERICHPQSIRTQPGTSTHDAHRQLYSRTAGPGGAWRSASWETALGVPASAERAAGWLVEASSSGLSPSVSEGAAFTLRALGDPRTGTAEPSADTLTVGNKITVHHRTQDH
jgi:hypothetical protein